MGRIYKAWTKPWILSSLLFTIALCLQKSIYESALVIRKNALFISWLFTKPRTQTTGYLYCCLSKHSLGEEISDSSAKNIAACKIGAPMKEGTTVPCHDKMSVFSWMMQLIQVDFTFLGYHEHNFCFFHYSSSLLGQGHLRWKGPEAKSELDPPENIKKSLIPPPPFFFFFKELRSIFSQANISFQMWRITRNGKIFLGGKKGKADAWVCARAYSPGAALKSFRVKSSHVSPEAGQGPGVKSGSSPTCVFLSQLSTISALFYLLFVFRASLTSFDPISE